jgi:hypothetical protein
MFKLEDVIQLKPEEKIRLVTKRHAVTILPRLLLSFLLIVIPFFFLFPLFKSGPTGAVVFVVSVGVGVYTAWRTFAVWDGDTFIVSSVRIVNVSQPGIFSRTVVEAGLEHLTDFAWGRRGITGTVFNFGDVTMNTAGQQKIIATKLPDPQAIHALLAEVVGLAKASRVAAESAHQARISRIQKRIEGLDDAALATLEHSLNEEGRVEAIRAVFSRPAAEPEPPEIPLIPLVPQQLPLPPVPSEMSSRASPMDDLEPQTAPDDVIAVKRFDADDEGGLILIPDPEIDSDSGSDPDPGIDPDPGLDQDLEEVADAVDRPLIPLDPESDSDSDARIHFDS